MSGPAAYPEDISYIVPYVYIGNRYSATGRFDDNDKYIDYLSYYNIKYVISALTDEEYADYMIAAEDFAEQTAWHRLVVDDIDDRYDHQLINSNAVNDEPQEPISRFFSQMTAVIADAIARKQPILIHCAAGMSRSVTIVAAYLIASSRLKPVDAIAFIKKKRPIAAPNKGFMVQLEVFSGSL
jgi:predicted protein tyrosine phosphatase